MRDTVVLSFDVDWAPDFVLRSVARRVREAGLPATWFVTHPSSMWDELRDYPEPLELGVHPNFAPGSTQGGSIEEVLKHLSHIVPEAVSMRSHGLYQSGAHLTAIRAGTGIRFDSSLFLPEHPGIRPVRHLTPAGALTRLPFIWADDYELLKPASSRWTSLDFLDCAGVKVLVFHPIHVFLNTPDFAHYERVKNAVGRMHTASVAQLTAGVYQGLGAAVFFERVLERMAGCAGATTVGAVCQAVSGLGAN